MPSLALALTIAVGVLLAAALAWLFTARRRLAAEIGLFADFMENGPFLAFVKDGEGRYIYENQALREFIKQIRPGNDSLIGKTDKEFFSGQEPLTYVANDRTVIAHGKPLQFEETSIEPDGSLRHWSSIKFPRTDAFGRPCVAGVTIDVTAVMQARSAARSSEDRCKLALEAGQMGSMSLDLQTLMLDTSPVFAVLHGNPETTTSISLADAMKMVHPDDRQAVTNALPTAIEKKSPHRIRYRVVKPDGTVAWIELVGNVSHDDAGRPEFIRAVGFDVTERQQSFEELSRRRDMLRRLIDIQENERQTLCHELHDGPIQYAIAAKMLLESARDEGDATVRAERIDAAIDCLMRGIAEGRQVIRGVRPAVLDDLGLVAAIEDLVEQMAASAITVETAIDDSLDGLPPALQTTIYRVVQESLANARKHSGAAAARVEVSRVGDEVSVCVSDPGSGFDVDESRAGGFGLAGMMERVRLAGGVFRIESGPGAGTKIHARLPICTAEEQPLAGGRSVAYAAAAPDLAR